MMRRSAPYPFAPAPPLPTTSSSFKTGITPTDDAVGFVRSSESLLRCRDAGRPSVNLVRFRSPKRRERRDRRLNERHERLRVWMTRSRRDHQAPAGSAGRLGQLLAEQAARRVLARARAQSRLDCARCPLRASPSDGTGTPAVLHQLNTPRRRPGRCVQRARVQDDVLACAPARTTTRRPPRPPACCSAAARAGRA